jgi:hypothetical protein
MQHRAPRPEEIAMNRKKLFLFILIGVMGMIVIPHLATAVVDNADSLYVGAGETYTLGGDHSYNMLVKVEWTGTLYVVAYSGSANTGYVDLYAPLVLVSGTINADARGFRGSGNYQEGPGVGSYPGGGASYGGAGGASGHGGGAKAPYGTTTGRDIEMGSGGGDTGGGLYGGGDGGGLIIVRGISVEITSTGTIEADAGHGLSTTWGAGAGSGGGIYIEAPEVLSRGRLSVGGGSGGSGTWGGGGGGGGRIKIFYCTLEDINSTVVLGGGSGGTGSFPGSPGGSGSYHTQLVQEPTITSIEDVENDQGRNVRLSWLTSCSDDISAMDPVTHYTIWRRVDELPVAMAALSLDSHSSQTRPMAYPPGDWDFVTEVPARGEATYNTVVPTLADSTVDGMYYSIFFVSAVTADPHVYFDSEPDSGYSVDNLAPNAPESFRVTAVTGEGSVELAWDESEAADFRYFALYRGTDVDFVPSEANRLAQLTGTTYSDVGAAQTGEPFLYYKLSAIDFAGNESAFDVANTVIVGVEPGVVLPTRIALYPSVPNPLRGHAVISFDLSVISPVNLTIFDARGRIVRHAIDRSAMPAGRHEWEWNGRDDRGVKLPAGVYLISLETPTTSQTKKAVIME